MKPPSSAAEVPAAHTSSLGLGEEDDEIAATSAATPLHATDDSTLPMMHASSHDAAGSPEQLGTAAAAGAAAEGQASEAPVGAEEPDAGPGGSSEDGFGSFEEARGEGDGFGAFAEAADADDAANEGFGAFAEPSNTADAPNGTSDDGFGTFEEAGDSPAGFAAFPEPPATVAATPDSPGPITNSAAAAVPAEDLGLLGLSGAPFLERVRMLLTGLVAPQLETHPPAFIGAKIVSLQELQVCCLNADQPLRDT